MMVLIRSTYIGKHFAFGLFFYPLFHIMSLYVKLNCNPKFLFYIVRHILLHAIPRPLKVNKIAHLHRF